jgi:hypothetical protein
MVLAHVVVLRKLQQWGNTEMSQPARVILESPYAGDVAANLEYARACVRDSLGRGEAPIASHLLYTQPGILRNDDPAERQQGIAAGLAWRAVADFSAFYIDRGWSRGMTAALNSAIAAGLPYEIRALGRPWAGLFRFQPGTDGGCRESHR